MNAVARVKILTTIHNTPLTLSLLRRRVIVVLRAEDEMRTFSGRLHRFGDRLRKSFELNGFFRDRRGNIGMIFVLMSGTLFLFVGGAVDYSRWNAVRADMIESMDAASLAVAQLQSDDDTLSATELEAFGDQFFLENFNYEDNLLPGWDVTFNVQSSGNIRTCMTGEIKTYLLSVAKIPVLDMDKCVEITPEGAGRIELAMVLDVTGSMSGQKMTDLKSAVDELLDVLYEEGETTSDNVRLGVVPFNQHVNAGGATSWDDANWGDQNAQSFYHGQRFFHVDSSGNIDMSTKVNHYRLYDSDPHRSWGGCVEARPYPLDEMDTVPGVALSSSDITAAMTAPSYADEPDDDVRDAFTNMPALSNGLTANTLASADNSRFVPVFQPDEPDCSSSACVYSNSGTTNGYNWYGYWFDDPDDVSGITESHYDNDNDNYRYIQDYRYTRYNQGTPFEKYVGIAYYIREVIRDNIVDPPFKAWLDYYGATNYGRDEFIGRTGYVGWWNDASQTYDYKYDLPKASSSAGPNPIDCPPPITPLTNDRTVIEAAKTALTADGGTNVPNGAVWGWRVVSPGAPFTEAIGPGEIGVGNTTEGDWQKAVLIMTDGNNDFSDRNTHWGSSDSAYGYEVEERMGDGIDQADDGANNMEGEADNKLLRICRRMKQENILVYAIVFDVPVGSTIEGIMQSCASEPTSPFFYNAANGADLEEAFGLIASDLVKLHVSQ